MYLIELNGVEFVVKSNGWMPKWIRPFMSDEIIDDNCHYDWIDVWKRDKYSHLPIARSSQDLLDLNAIPADHANLTA